MADPEHLALLKQGVAAWNYWRPQHPEIWPDLSGAVLDWADLSGANLSGVNLGGAQLWGADLSGANLWTASLSEADLSGANLHQANLCEADLTKADFLRANLSGADLSGANLRWANLSVANLSWADLNEADLNEADLYQADLSGANLHRANLYEADLSETNLSEANLSGADLTRTLLIETNFQQATIRGCSIYGISAWNVALEDATQQDLVITKDGEAKVTVDNLEVAQFIYLLLNNEKLREVIDTVTSKAVLILGRFTPERKAVLDKLREALRSRGYLPILFDFEKPTSRDLTEMISTLAHMARFIIADLTDAKSIPQELQAIVPNLPSVPVQPLLLNSDREYDMFEHFTRYPWVLPIHLYDDQDALLASLDEKVIAPAVAKANELAPR